MKTYKIHLHTNNGVDVFLINANNLDEAIKDAESQLEDGEHVQWATGQVCYGNS